MPLKDRMFFEEVCALVESISSLEFHEMSERLQHNFKQFSAGAKGTILQQRVGKGLPTRAELVEAEQAVVDDVIKLMNKAHFKLLKKEEWENAISEEFTFTMPVDINWEAFDNRLLTAYWGSSPENMRVRERLAEFADRILVFHRGVGVATQRDYFFNEKVDLLLDYLVATPFTKLVKALMRLVKPKKQKKDAASDEAAPKRFARSESVHKNRKVIERRTLRHVMPTTGSVLAKLVKKIDIQEPTFKDVVILYRKAVPRPKAKKDANVVKTISNTEKLRNVLARRNIVVKSFGEIPMADIELIFPDKKIYIKTQDTISLLVTVVSALVAAVAGLLKGGITLSVAWSALSTVGMAMMQVWNNMQAKKAAMAQEMSLQVYNIANDSQEGVLCYLLAEMAEQQLKEAVLAYALLLLARKPKTSDDLDTMCEDFLDENFELKLDFAIEDSLPRLKAWGMVGVGQARTGDLLYSATPLEEALAGLQHRWSTFYQTTSQKSLEHNQSAAGAMSNGVASIGRVLAKPFSGRPDFDDDGVSMVSDISYTKQTGPKKRKGLRALFSRNKQ